MGCCCLQRGQVPHSSLAALVEGNLLVVDPHGNLTLCGLFMARLCFAAVLAALVGCLTEGERAEPPSPRSPQCSQAAPERRVTWRGSSSCLMRLCEDSPGSNAAVPGGQWDRKKYKPFLGKAGQCQRSPSRSLTAPAALARHPNETTSLHPLFLSNSALFQAPGWLWPLTPPVGGTSVPIPRAFILLQHPHPGWGCIPSP